MKKKKEDKFFAEILAYLKDKFQILEDGIQELKAEIAIKDERIRELQEEIDFLNKNV